MSQSKTAVRSSLILSLLLLVSSGTGCVTFTRHAVPASRLPHQYQAPSKCNLHPINFQLLGNRQVGEHYLDTGDTIAVTVVGVFPNTDASAPVVPSHTTLSQAYYPPHGTVNSPSFGVPMQIQADGTLILPEIPAVDIRGLTLGAAAERIAKAYVDQDVLKPDAARVNLVLLKSRVNRVVVLREDSSVEGATAISRSQTIINKKGSADVIDLPYQESDVLHALVASGGLPGVDAYNEIWILRSEEATDEEREHLQQVIDAGASPSDAIRSLPNHLKATRIPLKLCAGEPLPFTPADIELKTGDIVYIEPRRDEYIYTGGLLPGGRQLLPRDEDLDIIEAIALSNGSVGGIGAAASITALRGAGNILPPTRVLILRKLPNGQQLPIRVDLTQAMRDPKERIKVMAGDYILVYYKPGEAVSNAFLNSFNIIINPR
jgi:hypothetical protein